ncbi:hypothetical protein TGDOM2_313440 [Toxoplasma gondii GAB2-2007-GAL-DOM2]|uniref:Transmembrane protein n=6 Tax=Toxoplasma gondii TaxID=5811 RepID=S7W1F7_TOXGG|nr:hypothetical protein TGGT1_313440 [Toxoplasma gondii GT1]KAF4639487.1 hypothetical protein TGRH88_052590 [Toxoplasma gondii]KFG37472.1 hypothetical protein TGDOM2_313440 [Toxoplasma gondii GAB2-2007-GAL-DOM2]KFG56134.1 hypothetical protein TGFOU_313440 [Toxoplasma gondii FOU]PUA91597.1 hypothetical protein TGBR9_313440 [Toxoplasma gondii TgCATBr9]RQX72724.1 hypothetical protein TGCAST_313440 [Toxoplasma gondii CAST]
MSLFVLLVCFLEVFCEVAASAVDETRVPNDSHFAPGVPQEIHESERDKDAWTPPENDSPRQSRRRDKVRAVDPKEVATEEWISPQSTRSDTLNRRQAEEAVQEYLKLLTAEYFPLREATVSFKQEEREDSGGISIIGRRTSPRRRRSRKRSTWATQDDSEMRTKTSRGFFSWLRRHQSKGKMLLGVAAAAFFLRLLYYGWTEWEGDDSYDVDLDYDEAFWSDFLERRQARVRVPQQAEQTLSSGSPVGRRPAQRKADLESTAEHDFLRRALDITPRFKPPPEYYLEPPAGDPATDSSAPTGQPTGTPRD